MIDELKDFYVDSNVINIPTGTIIHAVRKIESERPDPPNTSDQQSNEDRKPKYARRQ